MPANFTDKDIRGAIEKHGSHGFVNRLQESFENQDAKQRLSPDDFSIAEIFKGSVGKNLQEGREIFQEMSRRGRGAMTLLEATNAVDTSAFSNITGQILYNKIREGFNRPEFIHPQLVETVQTQFLNGEKIPGIGGVGDKSEVVGEGQVYPNVGLNEEYIQTVPLKKHGMILPITKEAIIADRTGLLMKQSNDLGYYAGVKKEKECIRVVTGATGYNNYKRNGVATNTYLTSGAYVNSHANSLTGGLEWRAIEAAELLFNAITDPNTGEPILIQPDTVIVPTALLRSFQRILNATEIQHVDMQANAATIRTTSANPYSGASYKIVSNQYVKSITTSASTWFIGQPKRAFYWMEAWGMETTQAASNNEAQFTQDIEIRVKVSHMGVAQVAEPRFMVKNT